MAELRDTAVVEIASCVANDLVENPFEDVAGRDAYLLRGLVYSISTGGFSVGICGPSVEVVGSSLGASETLHRWPVVALLPDEPEQVFITAHSAR